MGLFFNTKKGSIISTVDLPTTEIIEPDIIGYPTTKKIAVSTFEVVQKILASGSFSMVLISLYNKFFTEHDKKELPSILWQVTAVSLVKIK